ncbi:MAG: vitamin K epoxide reductase family protein [Chloroflexi bacterium]|nr:vitamin K epoxide reductase family protein [Chloroflexota bacterium]
MLARRPDALLALALVGTGVAAYLSWVAVDSEQQPFCSGVGDCQAVQSSEFAEIGGIPIAVLGLGMYVTLLALVAARRFWSGAAEAGLDRPMASATFGVALSGALYSGYLTYLELFEIEAICAWCVTSAVIVTLIMVLSVADLRVAGGSGARPTV